MFLPNHRALQGNSDQGRTPVRTGSHAQPQLLIEPSTLFSADAVRGLVDLWIVQQVTESFVRDLISSGEECEEDR